MIELILEGLGGTHNLEQRINNSNGLSMCTLARELN